MKKIIACFFTILTCSALLAKEKTERVSIVYEYRSDNAAETPQEAEERAFERAKQQALSNKYGVDVNTINATYSHSKIDGAESSSQTNVLSIGETVARGEWVATTSEKVLSKEFVKNFWIVKVKVEGITRAAKEKTQLYTLLLNDTTDKNNRTLFYDEDDIFLRFSSPVDGYLCMYLVDEEEVANCWLPSDDNAHGAQKIKANKEYLFLDEYMLTCPGKTVQNAIFIIFSPNQFFKATDKKGGKNKKLQQLPRQLPYEEFLQWLTKNQIKDEQMIVKREVITIQK